MTYFGPVLGRRGGDAAVQADGGRVGSRFPVAAVLTLAGLLLFDNIEVSAFDPEAAVRSGAAGGVGEHRLVVRYLQLLQLLVDLLQVRNSCRLPLHVA